jgi:hypothetical protein
MSALPSKADVDWSLSHVCFVPEADSRRVRFSLDSGHIVACPTGEKSQQAQTYRGKNVQSVGSLHINNQAATQAEDTVLGRLNSNSIVGWSKSMTMEFVDGFLAAMLPSVITVAWMVWRTA